MVRGSLEKRDFVAFYLKEGLLQAAVGLDRGRDVRRSGPLIRARRPLDPIALKDEDVDLKKLAASITRQGDPAK